jgi:Flp pilus assembly protein TadB
MTSPLPHAAAAAAAAAQAQRARRERERSRQSRVAAREQLRQQDRADREVQQRLRSAAAVGALLALVGVGGVLSKRKVNGR